MAAFQFPDPADKTTVVNPITGTTYQWQADPGKWVPVASTVVANDLIWEGDASPPADEEYKLWYSTDTLELYFYYCDINDVCAWLPTSVPVQAVSSLTATVTAQAGIIQDQIARIDALEAAVFNTP